MFCDQCERNLTSVSLHFSSLSCTCNLTSFNAWLTISCRKDKRVAGSPGQCGSYQPSECYARFLRSEFAFVSGLCCHFASHKLIAYQCSCYPVSESSQRLHRCVSTMELESAMSRKETNQQTAAFGNFAVMLYVNFAIWCTANLNLCTAEMWICPWSTTGLQIVHIFSRNACDKSELVRPSDQSKCAQ